MSINNRVVFLSYSFNRSDRRGVYQFARSLIEAIKGNHYDIGLFSQMYNKDLINDSVSNYLRDPNKYFFEHNNKFKIVLGYFFNKIMQMDYLFLNNADSFFEKEKMFNFFLNKQLLYYSNNIDLLFFKSLYLQDINLPGFFSKDIIFTDSPLAFKSNRHKMIQTVHDTIPLDEKRKYYQYFYKRLEACCYADKILAVSNHSKNKFLEYFPQMHDRVQVVYQPLPADENSIYLSSLPEIQQQVLDKYNLKSGQYMYYVGAVEKRKNIHNLVRAYAQVTHSDKSIPLVISGSIDIEYKKEFLLENYLVNHRNFSHSKFNIFKTDFVSDIEKLCLIRNSRAFLFPSLNEGFGIPIIEAQTLGVPVLTSNNSSLPEVTEGSALMLQNPLDVEEIAECIKRLWTDNELCENLSGKGLINIKRFSKENFKKGIGDFLADI
ncbi:MULTISPECIES: glycosyltransferase family 1 protein [Acinetobacter]|uniref:glycosyltransferase family 4 protein n=1 Tax=Acinetobacter TaxID=469 RepID=UPI00051BB26D|nr:MULTISPECIES: glycosyltransferase family 1 protein [Acinetobacter]MCH7379678.1 glycosyltransferase family 4 protein [Acinetobacter higginsii]